MRVNYHIGAHRTGTSSLQKALIMKRDELALAGLRIFTPQNIRQNLTQILDKETICKTGESLDEFMARFWLENADAEQIFICDENFIGGMNSVHLGKGMYHKAGKRITRLRDLTPEKARFHLTMRNYADFFASIFAYHYGGRFQKDFSAYKDNFMAMRRDWFTLAKSLLEALEPAQINLITYEAYQDDFAKLYQYLGLKSAQELPVLQSNQAPDMRGIAHLSEHMARKGRLAFHERVHLTAAFKDQNARSFDPWTKDERKFLDEKYAQDLERIERELGLPVIMAEAQSATKMRHAHE